MRGEVQVRLQPPVDVAVDELRQQRGVDIAPVDRAPEQRVDGVEDFLILIVGGTALLEQVPPQPRADVALDLAHHHVHANPRIGHRIISPRTPAARSPAARATARTPSW